MSLSEVTVQDVAEYISKLDTKKVVGVDASYSYKVYLSLSILHGFTSYQAYKQEYFILLFP